MDDGFQDPALEKTLSLLVVDAEQGFGNGLCLPAGPLREPVSRALARADAMVLVGKGAFQPTTDKPVFRAAIMPKAGVGCWRGRQVAAFAGIGRPAKFFATLREAGAELIAETAFADHHVYDEAELAGIAAAAPAGASMVTTEKDWVRLPTAWREQIEALPVELRFADVPAVDRFLRTRLEAA
jgi:tetraacyldisaccharide 4'-kinase